MITLASGRSIDVSPTLLMQIVRTALLSEKGLHIHTRNNEVAVSGRYDDINGPKGRKTDT